MIEDSIHYEQRTFLNQIATGWDVAEARRWYVDCCNRDPTYLPPAVRLRKYVEGVIRLVVDNELGIPDTFLYDVERIRALQLQCSFETHYRACIKTLTSLLARHGLSLPTHEVSQRLINRVAALLGHEGATRSPSLHPIALEIIRELNCQRKVPDLPDKHLVDCVVQLLLEFLDRQSSLFARLRDDLSAITLQEIQKLESLTPLQMLDQLDSGNISTPSEIELRSLSIMAKRIAHLAILHWRVWAPILYDQHRQLSKNDGGISAAMGVLSLDALTTECELGSVSQELPSTRRSLDEIKLEPRSRVLSGEGLDGNASESSAEYCDYSEYSDYNDLRRGSRGFGE